MIVRRESTGTKVDASEQLDSELALAEDAALFVRRGVRVEDRCTRSSLVSEVVEEQRFTNPVQDTEWS